MTIENRRPSEDPEVARLQALAREGTARLESTPAGLDDLWSAIEAEAFAAEPTGDAEVSGDPAPPARTLRPPARGWTAAVLGAAAALVVGLGIGVVLPSGQGGEADLQLAATQLLPLTADTEPVGVTLLARGDGRVVEVDLSSLPAPDGFYEVWLLDETVSQLVSLGPVRPDGTYVVPDGVDLVEVPSVDVSIEPADGDPSHSGVSVLRGTFTW
jgi:hypothetical protein